MKLPFALGWISRNASNPFVVIADADGRAVAQALGLTQEVAMQNARVIIEALNASAP